MAVLLVGVWLYEEAVVVLQLHHHPPTIHLLILLHIIMVIIMKDIHHHHLLITTKDIHIHLLHIIIIIGKLHPIPTIILIIITPIMILGMWILGIQGMLLPILGMLPIGKFTSSFVLGESILPLEVVKSRECSLVFASPFFASVLIVVAHVM